MHTTQVVLAMKDRSTGWVIDSSMGGPLLFQLSRQHVAKKLQADSQIMKERAQVGGGEGQGKRQAAKTHQEWGAAGSTA